MRIINLCLIDIIFVFRSGNIFNLIALDQFQVKTLKLPLEIRAAIVGNVSHFALLFSKHKGPKTGHDTASSMVLD